MSLATLEDASLVRQLCWSSTTATNLSPLQVRDLRRDYVFTTSLGATHFIAPREREQILPDKKYAIGIYIHHLRKPSQLICVFIVVVVVGIINATIKVPLVESIHTVVWTLWEALHIVFSWRLKPG